VKPSQDKAIVITGCDSGFGRTLALKLGAKGFKVYACCLTQRAMDELKKEVRKGMCSAASEWQASTRSSHRTCTY